MKERYKKTLRKIQNKQPSFVYSKTYPTRSSPGKFYGTAKLHKVPNNGTVDQLPLRLIISNTGTATYDLAKYLAQLLKPLSESQYAIKNGKAFTKRLKKMAIPPEYKMVSFDVVSLFTNILLDETIDIIIKRIYDKKEINTDIPKEEMRELLYLCTKNAHFTLNNKTHLQVDGVAMGSPLGPVLANIFMVELERNIIPTLSNDVFLWKRYVDDTICFIKLTSINKVLETLNSYHKNIKLTIETETENKLSFLDVLLIRNNSLISTKVYRKNIITGIYINWKLFAPNNWKWGTLKTLVTRAIDIRSTDEYLKEELEHMRTVFHHRNNYPLWVINKVIDDAKKVPSADENDSSSTDKIHHLMLPYQGDKGSNLLKSMKRYVSKLLPEHTKLEITFTGKKLNLYFSIKDKTSFEHQHDLIYYVNWTEPSCRDNYVGETGRRIIERIKDHSGRDHASHMVKHNIETSHTDVNTANFKIIDMNFSNNKRKRKIAESLWIKDLRTTLTVQEKSIPLKLSN